MADSYHHGNLRQALIDAGIKLINENGEENLSLRKVAAACKVSHAAPYAHFKDKEELIDAIKNNVTERFMDELEAAIEGRATADEAIIAMGKAYVTFFHRNPDYYVFLFGKQNITAHLKMNKEYKNDYPPFLLLRRMYLKHLKENGLDKSYEEQEIDMVKIWSIVHGMASIACMKGIRSSIDWNDLDERILV
ncbi:MAG: TetR/AcrR family transcriptional regulator [Clostridiales bacterium]|nr:TetR/AcrR family transcriptional regulator [Clostridiales bacterium]MBR3246958.1 TetR/AcrR family transcriptional regulator [Clostridiales bacterium]